MSAQAVYGFQPKRLRQGALAGLAGGVVFGAAMLELGGALPTIAGIVRSDLTGVGLLVHAVISTVIGVFFAEITRGRRAGPGELVFWGIAYGALWWLLGALTLLPILRGEQPDWSLHSVQAAFPSLIGHLAYGATAGAVLGIFGYAARAGQIKGGALLRGALAGVLAWSALTLVLERSGLLEEAGFGGTSATRWVIGLLLGALAGGGYAALYPRPRGATGPGLVRGLAYGFLLWFTLALSIVPVLAGDGLPWAIGAARPRAASLPGVLLAGVLLVALYRWFSGLAGTFFEDDVSELADEGVGSRALRGLGRGAVAGVTGGLIFTIVLAGIGGPERTAGLMGGSAPALGLLVQLAIATVIGASFGVLFRHDGDDPEAALGWGVAYGLLWWVLGGQTLLPVLLGGSPAWTATGLEDGVPSLVGYLAYGAGLGLTLAALERRARPWWAASTEARVRRAEERRRRLAIAAPGLWTMAAIIVLTVLALVAS
ncbi:MAG: hypothetical protein H0U42_11420 [Thermoleophilaceae bacterium]|nr:hypothetical protein [Thermoleophilaceae bacterium]